MENNDKVLKYASGEFYYFDMNPKDGNKPSLYFDGIVKDTGEHVKRNIKISKYFRCYDKETRNKITPKDYPRRDSIYKGNIQVETWEWNGYPCMRVLALEVGECIGKKNIKKSEDKVDDNPFIGVEFGNEEQETELLFG